jgi:hypothetical protein
MAPLAVVPAVPPPADFSVLHDARAAPPTATAAAAAAPPPMNRRRDVGKVSSGSRSSDTSRFKIFLDFSKCLPIDVPRLHEDTVSR